MKKLILIPLLLCCMAVFGQQYTLTKTATGFSVLHPGQTVANLYPVNQYRLVIYGSTFSIVPVGTFTGGSADVDPIYQQTPANVINGTTGLAFASLTAVQAYISTAVFH